MPFQYSNDNTGTLGHKEARMSFLRRGEIGSELTQSQSQCRAKSNEPEMKAASLLSIYLKNFLGDL